MPIFSDKNRERRGFFEQAFFFSKQYDVSIESYAVMNNHYHFILIQNENNDGIQKMIYFLQMNFAKSYNKFHKRRGPVFDSRYKAKIIENDDYFSDVVNYVFRNPIK